MNSPNFFEEKIKEKTLCFNFINLLFSKFSSEIIVRRQNDKYKKCKIQPIKTLKDPNIQSNKRINFKAFIKLLICISNKIFNPEFNKPNINTKYLEKFLNVENSNIAKDIKREKEDFIDIEKLLEIGMGQMQNYLENFILTYLTPVYSEIQDFFEKESLDILVFEKINKDSNAENFLLKTQHIFLGIFKFYSAGDDILYFEDFARYNNRYFLKQFYMLYK